MSRQRLIRNIVFVLLLTPLWSFLIWLAAPVKPMDILIMDKTVLHSVGNEHRSLNWLLTHHKYSKPDKKLYSIQNDYLGFFPIKRQESFFVEDLDMLEEYQVDSIAFVKDMVHYTDMYGIYRNEWYDDTTLWKERSLEIYGGMQEKDLRFLKKMKAQQKLILAEFNFYHHPTSNYIRQQAQDLLNIRWTGWIGRYFDPLDTILNKELPRWVIDNYLEQHGGIWPFSKAGIVFSYVTDQIEILEIDKDLLVEIPFIHTGRYGREKFNLPKTMHYPFWFDISVPLNDSNIIVSSFVIEPNERGDSILKANSIPHRFPALMESAGPSPYYYFGADYSDNPILNRTAYYAGSGLVDFLFYDQNYLKRTKFFYQFYRPLMKKILGDYYKTLPVNE